MEKKNFDEGAFIEALCTIHKGLPRGGPGNDAYTEKALGMISGLPAHPRVLDVGCGPGKQTLVLARRLGVTITALDFFQPFLGQLEADAEGRGLSHLVKPVLGDMITMEHDPESWDLIWCEGAIFIVGYEKGLAQWRPWLAPGGWAAVSECSFLVKDPPQEVKRFWDDVYPGIMHYEGNLEAARRAGYRVAGHFTLDPSAWWDGYYRHEAKRLDELEGSAKSDPALEYAISQARREMDLYRRYSDAYGLVFYIMQAD